MARSVRDLRELICLSRFGFRSDETDSGSISPDAADAQHDTQHNVLFYFDPSILNNWLELTSLRIDRLRTLSTQTVIDFIHFWLTHFDAEHKQSLFRMEFELFIEHLLLAFTPNDADSLEIHQFGRQVLHDIDQQLGESSAANDQNFVYYIDVFNRCKRDDHYRSLLANLPSELTKDTTNHLHLQWMLAIRAFGLVGICASAVEFFDKIQKTLDKDRSIGDRTSDRFAPNNPCNQSQNRVITALRKDYLDVIDYFIQTNQLPGHALDDQNRNVLFHALPLGNTTTIEHILQAKLPDLDIDAVADSGNSLVHLCVTLQRRDLVELLIKFYPELNLNQRNKQDATPLHLAIIYDDLDMARFLIQSSADASLTMKTKTCLQISTEFNYTNFVEFFSQPVSLL